MGIQNVRPIAQLGRRVNRAKVAGVLLLLALGTAAFPLAAAEADARRDAVVQAVERVMPSVVNISTETVVESRDPLDEFLREFWGPYYRRRGPDVQYSLGSGVIIDEEGYVLTNDHVVRRASRIRVRLADGRELEAEPVAGAHRSDVALLKIKAKPGTKFAAVRFAADDDLLLGETVIALGNPFGLGGSVSRGILSSKERRTPRENEPLDVTNWLQTDAAINPGNSGGPLVNLRGELIGINVAVFREAQGIGFAIPIKRVNETIVEFFSPERLKGLWFGARLKTTMGRMLVDAVQSGSPAEKAGLRAGDVIATVNGIAPRSFIQWGRLMADAGVEAVRLGIERGGEARTLSVRLVPEGDFFNTTLVQQRLGMSVQELTRELAEAMGLGFYGGFIIAGVEENGPAAKAGLDRGVAIRAMDGLLPADLVEFARLVHAKKKGEKISFNVLIQRRQGSFVQRRTATVEVTVR